jgi:hypothetical protein
VPDCRTPRARNSGTIPDPPSARCRLCTEHSRRVESRWLVRGEAPRAPEQEIRELAELATLGTMFSRIEHMRVVPFDLRSFGQLVGSTLGSLATLLALLHANGDLANFVDAIGKLFAHLSGGG